MFSVAACPHPEAWMQIIAMCKSWAGLLLLLHGSRGETRRFPANPTDPDDCQKVRQLIYRKYCEAAKKLHLDKNGSNEEFLQSNKALVALLLVDKQKSGKQTPGGSCRPWPWKPEEGRSILAPICSLFKQPDFCSKGSDMMSYAQSIWWNGPQVGSWASDTEVEKTSETILSS